MAQFHDMAAMTSRQVSANALKKSARMSKKFARESALSKPALNPGPKSSLRRESTSDAISDRPSRPSGLTLKTSATEPAISAETRSQQIQELFFKPVETDYEYPSSTPTPSRDRASSSARSSESWRRDSAGTASVTDASREMSLSAEPYRDEEYDDAMDGSFVPTPPQPEPSRPRRSEVPPTSDRHQSPSSIPSHPLPASAKPTRTQSRQFVPPTPVGGAPPASLRRSSAHPPPLGMRPRAGKATAYQCKRYKPPKRTTPAADGLDFRRSSGTQASGVGTQHSTQTTESGRSSSPVVPDPPEVLARMRGMVEADAASGLEMTARKPEPVDEKDAEEGNSSDLYWSHYDI